MSMKTLTARRLSTAVLVVALAVTSLLAVRAYALPQPNMETALRHLQNAKLALEKAEHNKGGFRVKAIEHVDQAIVAVREGIAAGNK